MWGLGDTVLCLALVLGSRHAVSPKLGLSGPRTDINSFLPILNRSEQFEENVHFRSFLVIPLVILFDI